MCVCLQITTYVQYQIVACNALSVRTYMYECMHICTYVCMYAAYISYFSYLHTYLLKYNSVRVIFSSEHTHSTEAFFADQHMYVHTYICIYCISIVTWDQYRTQMSFF